MAWRGVHISQPARLTVRDGQLVVAQEDDEVQLAIEDIAWLILDTPQVSLTGSLLSALVEHGVAMIVPDARHHPAGVFLSFHQHHAQAHVAHIQTGIGQPLKKRLWQTLVVAKIRNQGLLLTQLERPRAGAVLAMAERVGSGDPDNVEARAARAYWSDLFTNFIRADDTDRRNALLNYGYAVVRAALARACVASGLLPAFGLHHASRSNAFNLVDDLIEPFRPFVDRLAHERALDSEGDELTVEDRRVMAGILTRDAVIGAERMTLLAATEAVAMSAVRAMEFSSAALLRVPCWPDKV
ncbi:MAG: type II CRISPR-associated endonuclease Cas1 [Rhodospirillum sp.]|nr:type II CRISPR-associated endonuclease Cas1 [Rhodospirillum sp.]MCF8491201.1 type II CRISPR-associated endonuclease Cas1 [Rhodospirillum sp.]MCF8499603.1 type II CRISPR-associated endonuclease Cas1 [Rhodospirillum sp.]